MIKAFFLLLGSVFCCCPAAQAENKLSWQPFDEIHFGPRACGLERHREGGTHQKGYLYGLRGIYEHLGPYCFYWGGEGSWTQGAIHGKTGMSKKIKSRLSEAYIEGRIGYTFQHTEGCRLAFTPFVGVGYHLEKNHYVNPSPIAVHFKNHFYYIIAGTFFRAPVTEQLTLGLKAAALFSMKGSIAVSHDPNEKNFTLHYEHKIHSRMEAPLEYRVCFCGFDQEISLIPFFEFFHYGRHSAFPFDFLKTTIRIFGADFAYVIKF